MVSLIRANANTIRLKYKILLNIARSKNHLRYDFWLVLSVPTNFKMRAKCNQNGIINHRKQSKNQRGGEGGFDNT